VAWMSLFVVSLSGDTQHGRLDLLIVRRKKTHNGREQRPALSRTRRRAALWR